MTKYTLKNKLLPIVQEKPDWCIPACIEISLKYLQPNLLISQLELFYYFSKTKQEIANKNRSDFLQSDYLVYKELLNILPKFKSFTSEYFCPENVIELKKKMIDAIKQNYPILLSMPTVFPAGSWHTRVCHTITDKDITMYNPGNACDDDVENFNDIEVKTRNRNGGDILIIRLA